MTHRTALMTFALLAAGCGILSVPLLIDRPDGVDVTEPPPVEIDTAEEDAQYVDEGQSGEPAWWHEALDNPDLSTVHGVAEVTSTIELMTTAESVELLEFTSALAMIRPSKLTFSFAGFDQGDCLEIRDDGWAWLRDGKVVYAGKGPRAPAVFVRTREGTRWGYTFEVEMPTESEMWSWLAEQEGK